jgi:hypothetical protein
LEASANVIAGEMPSEPQHADAGRKVLASPSALLVGHPTMAAPDVLAVIGAVIGGLIRSGCGIELDVLPGAMGHKGDKGDT